MYQHLFHCFLVQVFSLFQRLHYRRSCWLRMSNGDRKYKPSKQSKSSQRDPYNSRTRKDKTTPYYQESDSNYGSVIHLESQIDVGTTSEDIHLLGVEVPNKPDTEKRAMETALTQMMQMIMQQQADRDKIKERQKRDEDRERRQGEHEAQREIQHAEFLKSLLHQSAPASPARSDHTTAVARPKDPIPHMGEKDDLDDYIRTFELQLQMSDIPAEQWKNLLYWSLTTENKVVAEDTYADQFSSYNDVMQVLLDSTGADAEAAADRMFSHDMDGICNTTPLNYMRRMNQWATRICQDARTRGEFQDTLVLARTTAALTKEGKQFLWVINPTTACRITKALAKWVYREQITELHLQSRKKRAAWYPTQDSDHHLFLLQEAWTPLQGLQKQVEDNIETRRRSSKHTGAASQQRHQDIQLLCVQQAGTQSQVLPGEAEQTH